MNFRKRLTVIENAYFVSALFVLLLNDFYLKPVFHNFLTGKLSDFAGVIVLFYFIQVFYSNRKFAFISSSLLFVFWKSPLSEGVIDFFNSFHLFHVGRVVDYTDLFALLVFVPLAFFPKPVFHFSFSKWNPALFFLGAFAIAATSRGDYRMFGEIPINKEMHLKTTVPDLLVDIEKQGVSYEFVRRDVKGKDTTLRYELFDLVEAKDTIFKALIDLKRMQQNMTSLKIIKIDLTKHGRVYRNSTYQVQDSIEQHYIKFAEYYFSKLADTTEVVSQTP